jgi:hypothetical protein
MCARTDCSEMGDCFDAETAWRPCRLQPAVTNEITSRAALTRAARLNLLDV